METDSDESDEQTNSDAESPADIENLVDDTQQTTLTHAEYNAKLREIGAPARGSPTALDRAIDRLEIEHRVTPSLTPRLTKVTPG